MEQGKIDYVKKDALKGSGIKRDLKGIKNIAQWAEDSFDKGKQQEREGLEPIRAEGKKIFIQALNKVEKYLNKLGIKMDRQVVERVAVYMTGSKNKQASYDCFHEELIFSKDSLSNKKLLLETFVHEIYHIIAKHKFKISQYKQKRKQYLAKFKSGYLSRYEVVKKKFLKKEVKTGWMLFGAFNEGVVEVLTLLTLGTKKMEAESIYLDETKMVLAIIDNVYSSSNQGKKKFFENYFSGNTMHLRKIEKFYGKGSLALLSRLETSDIYKEAFNQIEEEIKTKFGKRQRQAREEALENNKRLFELVMARREKLIKFFSTKDEKVRTRLGEELIV